MHLIRYYPYYSFVYFLALSSLLTSSIYSVALYTVYHIAGNLHRVQFSRMVYLYRSAG